MFSGLFWAGGSWEKHQTTLQEKLNLNLLRIVRLKKVQLETLKLTLNKFYTDMAWINNYF